MARKQLPQVRCIASFVHVIPATVLEIRSIANSAHADARIETPEKRISYEVGSVHTLGSKSALKLFMKCWPGAFEAVS